MQNRKRDTDVQNSLLDSVGEGKSGMFRENSIETSILSRHFCMTHMLEEFKEVQSDLKSIIVLHKHIFILFKWNNRF